MTRNDGHTRARNVESVGWGMRAVHMGCTCSHVPSQGKKAAVSTKPVPTPLSTISPLPSDMCATLDIESTWRTYIASVWIGCPLLRRRPVDLERVPVRSCYTCPLQFVDICIDCSSSTSIGLIPKGGPPTSMALGGREGRVHSANLHMSSQIRVPSLQAQTESRLQETHLASAFSPVSAVCPTARFSLSTVSRETGSIFLCLKQLCV
jgi:hypothetical protein